MQTNSKVLQPHQQQRLASLVIQLLQPQPLHRLLRRAARQHTLDDARDLCLQLLNALPRVHHVPGAALLSSALVLGLEQHELVAHLLLEVDALVSLLPKVPALLDTSLFSGAQYAVHRAHIFHFLSLNQTQTTLTLAASSTGISR